MIVYMAKSLSLLVFFLLFYFVFVGVFYFYYGLVLQFCKMGKSSIKLLVLIAAVVL